MYLRLNCIQKQQNVPAGVNIQRRTKLFFSPICWCIRPGGNGIHRCLRLFGCPFRLLWVVVKIVVCKQMQAGNESALTSSMPSLSIVTISFYVFYLWAAVAQYINRTVWESLRCVSVLLAGSCATPTLSCQKWSLTLSRWRCFIPAHTNARKQTQRHTSQVLSQVSAAKSTSAPQCCSSQCAN